MAAKLKAKLGGDLESTGNKQTEMTKQKKKSKNPNQTFIM